MHLNVRRRILVISAAGLVCTASIVMGSFVSGISRHLFLIVPLITCLKIIDRRHDRNFKKRIQEEKISKVAVSRQLSGRLLQQ